MKRMHILSVLLCMYSTMQGMDAQLQQHVVALPDWKGMHNQLVTDYQNILKDKLEEYIKADITTWNIKELDTIGNSITKHHIYKTLSIIGNIVDAHNNTFLHYAVIKEDEKTVKFLTYGFNHNKNYHTKNNDGETPFDLCIKKLLPNIPADNKVISKTIFNELSSCISIWCKDDAEKINCLKKIIDLHLKYMLSGTDFSIRQQKLIRFITPRSFKYSTEEEQVSKNLLAHYYQQAKDENGNTFAHASSGYPDALFELVKKDHVSFAKNNSGKTALDCAMENLRGYTQNADQMIKDPEELQKASCCVYILLNHAKALAQKGNQEVPDTSNISDFGPCCEKHTLPSF
jgi:hypothetical protein